MLSNTSSVPVSGAGLLLAFFLLGAAFHVLSLFVCSPNIKVQIVFFVVFFSIEENPKGNCILLMSILISPLNVLLF